MNDYNSLFYVYRKDTSEKARQYISGLMQAGIKRKNMERMVEVVPNSDHQAVHHFISNSSWDAQAVMDQVAITADSQIGDIYDSCLLIDESSFAKKGKASVGVGRQWLGNLGKVDNGQVGVFSALCKEEDVALIDTRLYLPEDWTSDEKRCLKAGVPLESIKFKTKEELALELVEDAQRLKLRYGWIGADGGYGKGLEFMLNLEGMGEIFVVDIHKNQTIFEKEPKAYIPKNEGRGRKAEKYRVDEKPIRVDKFVSQRPESDWKTIELRCATKGTLTFEVLTVRIWVWHKEESEVRQWHLIVRRDPKTHGDYKYSLSNAPVNTSRERLAYMQSQRFWIEQSFRNAKSDCGMADYQVRGWVGWHHHMALTMMGLLFMLSERILNREERPLLTCADIESLLAVFLPRRDTTVEEVMSHMERRHKQRQADIDSAARRQKGKRVATDNFADSG